MFLINRRTINFIYSYPIMVFATRIYSTRTNLGAKSNPVAPAAVNGWHYLDSPPPVKAAS